MLLKLIRFLRGYVTFKITGGFPERFINLALKNGIGIFDAVPKDRTIVASMVISDYRNIRNIARRSSVRLKIIRRHGLPFITFKYRHRLGLAVGVALFIIASLILQNFVWSVEINGVETLSEVQLLSSLENAGFKVGKFKGSLDLHKTERQILLEYKEIGWMSINLIGTHAEIEIKEKALPPKQEYNTEYSNIIAAKDGIILSTSISRGTAEVSAGSAVSQGQLLVSGLYENALGEVRFVDAHAKVIANTSYNFTASVDEAVCYQKPVSIAKRSELNVLWFKLPVAFSPEASACTAYNKAQQVYLFDNPIPLLINTEEMCTYEAACETLSEKAALNRLNTELSLYKLFELKDTLSLEENFEITKVNNSYTLKSELNCTEDIAVKEKLIVNEE